MSWAEFAAEAGTLSLQERRRLAKNKCIAVVVASRPFTSPKRALAESLGLKWMGIGVMVLVCGFWICFFGQKLWERGINFLLPRVE